MKRLGSQPALLLLIQMLAAVAGAQEPEPDPAARERLQLNSDLRVRVQRGREIQLEVHAAEGQDYAAIAERVCGSAEHARALSAWNADEPPRIVGWVRVPMALLSDAYRSLVLRSLFPDDRLDGEDWVHVARAGALPTYDEGLWQIAEWYTGDGGTFLELMGANKLSSPEVRRGQLVRIPAAMLHPTFRAPPLSDDNSLEYGSDGEGPYAAYRLRAGEALYSAVVVRFTGRTAADDVIGLAKRIQERSGIRDLRDIPVGFVVKIPLELLEPQFLPRGHPRRLDAESARDEMERELARRPVTGTRGGLEGVLIVLDPGHGGRDLGTMNNGIWEHDYVYDVACRLKQKLERETAATVRLTLLDKQTGCSPSKTDKLKANRRGSIATTPPFLAKEEGEAKIGVNLRWYLANSIYRHATSNGVDADRVVFLSLHADARHASLRGVMVYVPGASYRTKTYGHSGKPYSNYEEVREKPHIRFSKSRRVRSEAVSRKLADVIVREFEDHDLPVQEHQPVRHRIIRGKARYVPAVLRANMIPNKVLVEMVNLSNRDDAALLASARDRDRLAEALIDALFRYFGEKR